MLNQTDMVRFLSQEPPPPQHVAFSILHAYVFSKSRRGNLPSETLSKLLSVQRKLLIKRGGKPFGVDSPIARAFEAMRIQMLIVNKKWLTNGVEAFGPLGAIGSTGNSPLAIEAWRKATDNKVKDFPSSSGDSAMGWGVPGGGTRIVQELDAGRVVGPGFTDSADPSSRRRGSLPEEDEFLLDSLPPGYEPPPGQDPEVVGAMDARRNGETERPASLTASEGGRTASNDGSPPPAQRNSIEAGVSELARLRAIKEERERKEEEENRRRITEESEGN